jgi:LPS export ABC transporter protein LptC
MKIAVKYSFILLCFVLLGTSCENDIEVIQSFAGDTILPDQSMINAEIEYTDSARLQLRITAPEIHHYSGTDERYTEFPSGIFAQFFDSEGNVESHINAKYAINYTDKELWEARDSVVVINSKGEVLNTEQLFWDERNQLIYSSSYVEITRPNEKIMGEGFEADETFNNWIIKRISGTIWIPDDDNDE